MKKRQNKEAGMELSMEGRVRAIGAQRTLDALEKEAADYVTSRKKLHPGTLPLFAGGAGALGTGALASLLGAKKSLLPLMLLGGLGGAAMGAGAQKNLNTRSDAANVAAKIRMLQGKAPQGKDSPFRDVMSVRRIR